MQSKIVLLEIQTDQANRELKDWIKAAIEAYAKQYPQQAVNLAQIHVQKVQQGDKK